VTAIRLSKALRSTSSHWNAAVDDETILPHFKCSRPATGCVTRRAVGGRSLVRGEGNRAGPVRGKPKVPRHCIRWCKETRKPKSTITATFRSLITDHACLFRSPSELLPLGYRRSRVPVRSLPHASQGSLPANHRRPNLLWPRLPCHLAWNACLAFICMPEGRFSGLHVRRFASLCPRASGCD
jgi:hypothetical protein